MPAQQVKFTAGTPLPTKIYVDSNIFISFLDKNHPNHREASTLLLEALASGVKVYVSTLVLDEVWYVLMRCWQKDELGTKFDSKNKSHVACYAACLRRKTNELFELFEPELIPLGTQPKQIMDSALQLMEDENLAPRDSYHLAYALASELNGFATIDGDFLPLASNDINLSVISIR